MRSVAQQLHFLQKMLYMCNIFTIFASCNLIHFGGCLILIKKRLFNQLFRRHLCFTLSNEKKRIFALVNRMLNRGRLAD